MARFRFGPPAWIPWLGPLAALAAGGLAARLWLHGGLWTTLGAALVCGFAPIIGYRIWKWRHHRRDH